MAPPPQPAFIGNSPWPRPSRRRERGRTRGRGIGAAGKTWRARPSWRMIGGQLQMGDGPSPGLVHMFRRPRAPGPQRLNRADPPQPSCQRFLPLSLCFGSVSPPVPGRSNALLPQGLSSAVPGQRKDPQESAAEGSAAGGVEARLKRTDKEPEAKMAAGSGKEKLKAGATPRSPARRKTQPAPPPLPPPPPPTGGEELPWGDLSLNKCLVLASLVALLGGAFQLCRDSVTWEASAPAPVPEPWVPPSSAPKEPAMPQPKPQARASPRGLPDTQVEAERAEGPRSREAAEKDQGKLGGHPEEEPEPRTHRGPKERRAQQRPREERPREEKRPRKEKQRWEEKPRKEKRGETREPPEAPLRRREAREGSQGPWARVSGDPKLRKRPARASPRFSEEEEARPPGRQKHRPGKGWD
ncbi:Junctional sarcoplasmic reticulum protein 1 [Galemys pyrenaicus]|uniref:Junctional sarcoplasmic reticulum protein 1 n=1 Tax=Galemys pyrenaicus TaxID=202257 RepID=A0A8J6AI09_GALPY|nr:Junctional sarcoplasmic reticulum protein 1 [Galemys pyrenaicus]